MTDQLQHELGNGRDALEITVVLPNAAGLHARSAALVVKASARYRSVVTLSVAGRTANASSLMDLLRLGARKGNAVRIRVDGQDARAALDELKSMMENGFDED